MKRLRTSRMTGRLFLFSLLIRTHMRLWCIPPRRTKETVIFGPTVSLVSLTSHSEPITVGDAIVALSKWIITGSSTLQKKSILVALVRVWCGPVVYLTADHATNSMWVNNCVGFWNHKFFLQTLILAWTGCIIVLVFSILRTVFHPFEFDTDDDDFVRDLIYFIIFCAGNLCVVAQLFSLSGMVFFHLYLISHNMTHIEYNCCKGMASGCRFNRGLLFNLFELLGKYWILSLVPYYIPPEGLHGDNYKPISGGSEVDQALIEEWRKKRAKKRCGGMGDLCTGPCQAFS
jgi:hypothetical protein